MDARAHLKRELLESVNEFQNEVARHEQRRELRALFGFGFLVALLARRVSFLGTTLSHAAPVTASALSPHLAIEQQLHLV